MRVLVVREGRGMGGGGEVLMLAMLLAMVALKGVILIHIRLAIETAAAIDVSTASARREHVLVAVVVFLSRRWGVGQQVGIYRQKRRERGRVAQVKSISV